MPVSPSKYRYSSDRCSCTQTYTSAPLVLTGTLLSRDYYPDEVDEKTGLVMFYYFPKVKDKKEQSHVAKKPKPNPNRKPS